MVLIGVGPHKDSESLFPHDPRAQAVESFFEQLSKVESMADHVLVMQAVIIAFLKAHPAYATGIAPLLHEAINKGCSQCQIITP